MPLILSRAQVRELLDMPDAIEAVERGLIEFSAGQAVMPVRVTTQVPTHSGIALGMPAFLGATDALGTKIVTVYKNNPSRGLPTILAVVVLNDPQTGKVENWGFETGNPVALVRQGWTRDTMKIGMVVTIEGTRAKDGTTRGNARNILVNGKKLSAASSEGTNP